MPQGAARNLAEVDTVILAGGLGSRIVGVLGNTPKILAPFWGRPFVDYLLDWLATSGARHVILSLGHLAEAVVIHLSKAHRSGVQIDTVVEPQPLGTGGGLRLALERVTSDRVLVLNGDSWTDVDLSEFFAAHMAGGADISMLVVEVPDCRRFGRVEVDSRGRITRFIEKDESRSGPGFINAGIYLFEPSALRLLKMSTGSRLEGDFLQKLPSGSIYGYKSNANFVDIGTPQSFIEAKSLIKPKPITEIPP